MAGSHLHHPIGQARLPELIEVYRWAKLKYDDELWVYPQHS